MKSKLPWRDEEIVRSYLEAADRAKQITILSELNGCSIQDIREVLRRAGCDVPKIRKRKSNTKILFVRGTEKKTIREMVRIAGVSRSYLYSAASRGDSIFLAGGQEYTVMIIEDGV